MNHLGRWKLLGPGDDVCQECAVNHAPEMPHDAQSLYYQYRFYDEHGRWPTWGDAMAHCSDEAKLATTEVLAAHGLGPDGPVRL